MKFLKYPQLFHGQEDQEKLDTLLFMLDAANCYHFQWKLGDGPDGQLDDIRLKTVTFRYQREMDAAKYVEIIYNVKHGGFYITNSVTGTGIYRETPEAAAAVAISYADSFTAYR